MPISAKFTQRDIPLSSLTEYSTPIYIIVDGVEYSANIYSGVITISGADPNPMAESDWDYYGYVDIEGDVYLSISDEDGEMYLVDADPEVIGEYSSYEIDAIIMEERQ